MGPGWLNRRMTVQRDSNSWRYGDTYAGPITLRRVSLDRGGYTKGGRYFGVGAPLFEYEADGGPGGVFFDGYVRGADRESAKAKLRAMFPHAKGLGGPRRAKQPRPKPNARPDADPDYAAEYNRGWNKGARDMKGDQAYAAELADRIFDGTAGNLDLFGGYDRMPGPAFRRGWKDAVFEVANHGQAASRR